MLFKNKYIKAIKDVFNGTIKVISKGELYLIHEVNSYGIKVKDNTGCSYLTYSKNNFESVITY